MIRADARGGDGGVQEELAEGVATETPTPPRSGIGSGIEPARGAVVVEKPQTTPSPSRRGVLAAGLAVETAPRHANMDRADLEAVGRKRPA